MYHSGLEYDFAVTQISTVVERMPDPRWKMEMGVNGARCVLCAALDGEAVYQFQKDSGESETENGEKTVHVSRGDAMFFLPGRLRSAVSVPENPWRFITASFDLVMFSN